MPNVNTGAPAIDSMIEQFPECHVFFGDHRSSHHFAMALERPGWWVAECDGCWVMLERVDADTFEGHFFCPSGFRTAAVHAILQRAFPALGIAKLIGITPKGHPCERAARTAARALGMEDRGGIHVLTASHFLRILKSNR